MACNRFPKSAQTQFIACHFFVLGYIPVRTNSFAGPQNTQKRASYPCTLVYLAPSPLSLGAPSTPYKFDSEVAHLDLRQLYLQPTRHFILHLDRRQTARSCDSTSSLTPSYKRSPCLCKTRLYAFLYSSSKDRTEAFLSYISEMATRSDLQISLA